MKNTLLIVPESRDGSALPVDRVLHMPFPAARRGVSVWPAVGRIREAAQAHEWVAVTGNTDTNCVQAMLQRAQTLSASSSSHMVYADEPLLAGFRDSSPAILHGLLCRLLPTDLIVMRSEDLRVFPADGSLAEAIVSLRPATVAMPVPPAIDRFPDVGPGRPALPPHVIKSALNRALKELPGTSDSDCVYAGVLLLWDHLDESHQISQALEGQGIPRTADYWHGIMHRREPDAGNAAYWFRRVGPHPAMHRMSRLLYRWMTEANTSTDQKAVIDRYVLAGGQFDPMGLTDLSQIALKLPDSCEDQTMRMVQYVEILNLLQWSLGTPFPSEKGV